MRTRRLQRVTPWRKVIASFPVFRHSYRRLQYESAYIRTASDDSCGAGLGTRLGTLYTGGKNDVMVMRMTPNPVSRSRRTTIARKKAHAYTVSVYQRKKLQIRSNHVWLRFFPTKSFQLQARAGKHSVCRLRKGWWGLRACRNVIDLQCIYKLAYS